MVLLEDMKTSIELTPEQNQLISFFETENDWANCIIDVYQRKFKSTDLQFRYSISAGVVVLIQKLISNYLDNEKNSIRRLDNTLIEWKDSSRI